MLRREGTWGSQEEVRGVSEDWERDEDRVSREESRVSRGTSSHILRNIIELFVCILGPVCRMKYAVNAVLFRELERELGQS